MTTLIMLCGQGSTGKSTFARTIKNQFQNDAKIHISSMDYFVKNNSYFDDPEGFYKKFLSDAQYYLNENYDIVIVDFCFDTVNSRKKFLQQLNLNKKLNFIAIRACPPVEIIHEWHAKRRKQALSHEEKETIQKVYNSFQELTTDEFEYYNFNSIQLYSIDTSKISMEETKNDK